MSGVTAVSPRTEARTSAASWGSLVPPKPRRLGSSLFRRAITSSRSIWLFLVAGIAETEKHAAAPHAELRFPVDLFIGGEIDELVKDRPRETSLEAGAYQNIRRRLTVGGGF